MDINALIAKKQKEIKSKQASSQRTAKLNDGKNILRILPTWRTEGEPEFWHDYGMHFVKDNAGKAHAYICESRTFGNDCEICNTIGRAIASSGDDKQIEKLKECNSSQRYLLNAINVGAKKDEVELYEVPSSVFNALIDLMQEWGDITDWAEGRAVIINREGSGLNTKYTVTPAPKPLAVAEDKYQDKLFNLDDYCTASDDTRMKTLVSMVAGIGGIHAAKMLPPSGSAKFEVSDVDDAEFEEFDEDLPESFGSADEMDDLDALLDDVDLG